MNDLVIFQQTLTQAQQEMINIHKLFIGFWKELEGDSPNFQYLGNTSHEISFRSIHLRNHYQNLIKINPGNTYCRMLYALFLKKVMKDEYEAFDIYESYFY